MGTLLINDKNIIFTDYEEKEYEVENKDLIHYLYDYVKLENVSLRRIFEIVKPIVNMWKIILNEDILPLFKNISKTSENIDNELKYLEITWDCEYDGNLFCIETSIHGCDKEGILYRISLTPINELLDLEIKLNLEFMICHTYYQINPDKVDQYGDKPFTLLEIMKAIFSELTFYTNTDDEKSNIMNENKKIVDEYLKTKENN